MDGTMNLKLEKEAFVSGLEGTTIAEIYLITSSLVCGYLHRCTLLVCIPTLYRLASSSVFASFLLEYTTTILPGILLFTVLADYAVYFLLIELLMSSALILNGLRGTKDSVGSALSSPYPNRSPYLTLTRTYVNLFTAIAILAVDFDIFPRRLAKAETYGSGMMDIGVGLFLMAHGLTSPEARRQGSSDLQRRNMGYLRMVGVTVRGVFPLLVLGLVRLVAVKSTGYQEHVTEYGVHWNFFFTIAAVRILCSALHPLVVSLPYGHGLVSLLTAVTYQGLLQWGGLEHYVLLGPNGDGSRIGLISANREGIFSCIGYVALYTGWVQIGKWLFKPRRLVKEYIPVLLVLALMFLALWFFTSLSSIYIQPISRRLVNLSYIVWIFSCGAMVLTGFLATDLVILLLSKTIHASLPPPYTLQTHTSTSPIPLCTASAVDYNQLMFFISANVGTGLVNFSMDTLHARPVIGLAVLIVYMGVLLILFIIFYSFRFKIKL